LENNVLQTGVHHSTLLCVESTNEGAEASGTHSPIN